MTVNFGLARWSAWTRMGGTQTALWRDWASSLDAQQQLER